MIILQSLVLLIKVSIIDSKKTSQTLNTKLLPTMRDQLNLMHFNSISIQDQSILLMAIDMI
jgi:hypothetical protein